ncbi:MAG: hypothetical protein WAW10_14905 [Gallionella sp.]
MKHFKNPLLMQFNGLATYPVFEQELAASTGEMTLELSTIKQ